VARTQTIEESLVTARGYQLLEDELTRLRSDGRRQMSERLRQAREDGRPDDNPALGDLFEEQAQLETRIATLEAQLASAQIAPPASRGRAGVGSAVRVRHLDDDQVAEYELVGVIEPDVGNGRVSLAAPVGRALVGCRAGARVEVVAPGGVLGLEILSVRSSRSSGERTPSARQPSA
jgi:transcription elongation factor GreA